MGRQVNFFLGPEDLRTLATVVNKVAPVALLKFDPRDQLVRQADEVVPEYGSERLQIWICREVDAINIIDSLDKKQVRLIDLTLRSNVIEFFRPFVTETFIRSGRLFCQDSYWNETQELIRKPDEWLTYSKHVFSAVRKSLIRIGESGYYAGLEAMEMRASGALFQEIDDPRGLVCI